MEEKTNFLSAIAQIAEEKGISIESVLESIESALAAAYKKEYGKKGQKIVAKFDPESGEARFWQVRFIMIEEAKKIDPKIKSGQELLIPLETHKDYGRIAAQTAKQVILQKIREAERETIFNEYKSKEGEIVSGIVQRVETKNVFLDIGKAVGILPKSEQVPGEFYRPGQRLKVYVLKVEDTPKGPTVCLSRAYPKLVSKLFELEVPEVAQGQVATLLKRVLILLAVWLVKGGQE